MNKVTIRRGKTLFELPSTVKREDNGDIIIIPQIASARIVFDEDSEIIIPISMLPAQPGNSLEDRMRLRHACIQMAIQANLVKADGTKRNIHEVALEIYNFIVK